MLTLKDKVVLITGGGSGIGLACADLFLKEGARVAITGRDQAKLDKAKADLKGGDRLLPLACDVTQVKQVEKVVTETQKRLGGIDILINNAGTNLKERGFRELTTEAWDKLVRTNLDGAFYVIHAVFPEMAKRKDGVIINVVSTSGKRATPLGGVAYAAAKFGMSALGLALGAEEKDSGVRFCNVYPGEVDTPILEFRPSPISEEHRARILKSEDVAAAIVFVARQPAYVSIPELVIKPTTQVYV
ncbi:MAG: SDR family oxidoreductase [Gemmataceae bacterium]